MILLWNVNSKVVGSGTTIVQAENAGLAISCNTRIKATRDETLRLV